MKTINLKAAVIISTFLFCGIKAVSQKLAKTDITYSKSYSYFPAIIADISKPTTISSTYPARLKYTAGLEFSNINPSNDPTFAIGGKWVPSNGEYQIVLACNGATDVKEGKGRAVTVDVPNSSTSWNAKITKYVKDYEVFIPAALVVLHHNDTLKIVELSSSVNPIKIVFHKGLVDAAARVNNSGIVGFEDDIEAERYLPQAIKIVEQQAYIIILQKAANVQRHLLKNYLTNGESTVTGIIKKKKRSLNYDDYDSTIEKYKAALKAVTGPSISTDSLYLDCIKDFEKMLASGEARIDANVKELLYYNLANCYARVGALDKATTDLSISAATLEKYEPSMIGTARAYIRELELRKLLKQGNYISLSK